MKIEAFGWIKDSTDQKWKPVKDYPGYYVSDTGLVVSHKYKNYQLLKQQESKKGYLRVTLFKDGHHKKISVHQLVATHFISEIPFVSAVVNHKDGDKKNNKVNNLEWCSVGDNLKHYWKDLKGTHRLCRDIKFTKDDSVYRFTSLGQASKELRLHYGRLCRALLDGNYDYKGYKIEIKEL
jgi:hypothetical protein